MSRTWIVAIVLIVLFVLWRKRLKKAAGGDPRLTPPANSASTLQEAAAAGNIGTLTNPPAIGNNTPGVQAGDTVGSIFSSGDFGDPIVALG